ncbi:hypothetical protein ASG12_12275 [Williamsia sp. Leaf354]|jgi:hypothetical protein|uniref:hypothetical protein n=1 Tax=Williamsia sp. Leaf354 TaxID=1736349 RepID=UPI0006F20D4C|nr:hypothetical protein [Williamsia sp. Leaf354]KQR97830.1 hypothetical protein ASG12_12275 [Williamsia sp. Leaf354]
MTVADRGAFVAGATDTDATHSGSPDSDATDTDWDPDLDEAGGSASGTRRRRDRTGVADRPRENRSPAAQRAIDRRRRRATQRSTTTLVDRRERPTGGVLARIVASPADLLRRMPFAVLVVAILAVGLGLTLWLSTTAAQTSYELSAKRQENQTLIDRRDALKKSFESGDSAPELSDKATALGMIPASNVPRLVVAPDGRTRVEGEIAPATGTAAPSMNAGRPTAVTPQPGSSTGGNTAALPASAGVPGAAAADEPLASNVLPGASGSAAAPNATAPNPTPGAAPAGSAAPSANSTAPTSAPRTPAAPSGSVQTAPGSADSQIPR